MRIQAKEELEHAMKFFDQVLERQGTIVLQAVDAPPAKWKTAKDVFEAAYQHEQKVTESIHKIVELARAEKDHATGVFLDWFVKEQVEEEASTNEVLQKLKLAGTDTSALLVLDSELAKRGSSSK